MQRGGTRLQEINGTWLSSRAQDQGFQATVVAIRSLREQQDVCPVIASGEVAEVPMKDEGDEGGELQVKGRQPEIRAEGKHRNLVEPALRLTQCCGVSLEKPHPPNARAGVRQLSFPDLPQRLATALHLEGDSGATVRRQDIRAPTFAVWGQSGDFDRRLPSCISDGLSDE